MTEQTTYPWMNEHSRLYLSRGYIPNGITPEQRIADIGDIVEKRRGYPGYSKKFQNYMARNFYSMSSPMWSNFGTDRGFPVSCFGAYPLDTMTDILYAQAEVGAVSKYGGGSSAYLGFLRERGAPIGSYNGESRGSVHFAKLYEEMTKVVSQGGVRKGQCAVYQDIDHPDAEEFIDIGSLEHPIQSMTHGINFPDSFMNVLTDKGHAEYQQKAPKWVKWMKARNERGYPYGVFIDNVNNNTVDVYKDKAMRIYQSNLCTEIALPTADDEMFVCVLASMNILSADDWEDDAVEVLVILLETVIDEFIEKLEVMRENDPRAFSLMERAYNFVTRHRALGIGAIGYHSYLQSKRWTFESREAAKFNHDIFKRINEDAWEASRKLAEELGEPEVLKGYGRRHTTLTAVAPTRSSSFIHGQISKGIEPWESNYFIMDEAKVKKTHKNPYLEEDLEDLGYNTREVWDSIMKQDGSVQHLDFLPDHLKDVYRTWGEISNTAIIDQAAIRQQYIDQSQSLNLKVGPAMTAREISEMYIYAWKMGIKSVYYQEGTSAVQEAARSRGCVACES